MLPLFLDSLFECIGSLPHGLDEIKEFLDRLVRDVEVVLRDGVPCVDIILDVWEHMLETSNVGREVLVVDLLINDPVDNSILDAITLGDGELLAEYCFVLLGLGGI